MTCRPGLVLTTLSVLAVGLGIRELWRLWKGPGRSVPQDFGPIERVLAGAGLLIVVLYGMLQLVGIVVPSLSAVGSAALDMLVRAVTLGVVSGPTKLGQLLLAVAFWLVELKQLRGLLPIRRNSRSTR